MYKIRSITKIIVILFTSELCSSVIHTYWLNFLISLFSNFILYFQLRLSPVPHTLPVPIPCYYHGSSNDNGHANNYYRPLSLPAPSRTEADPTANTEIIAGSLQVSNWHYNDEHWQSVFEQICFPNTGTSKKPYHVL
jgi:hypothetical protein